MDLIEGIKTRRSIRKFESRDVSSRLIEELIDCARHAPSSGNCQSWEFIVVKDSKTKDQLAKVHPYAAFVSGAPVVIVCGYDEGKSKYYPSALLNPAIAVENLLLAATAKQLGTCWVFVRDKGDPAIERKVKQLLLVPDHIGIICMVPLGYPAEQAGPRRLRAVKEMVHYEDFES